MKLNLFMLSISVLYVGAAGVELYRGSRGMAIVYGAWAISNTVLAFKG